MKDQIIKDNEERERERDHREREKDQRLKDLEKRLSELCESQIKVNASVTSETKTGPTVITKVLQSLPVMYKEHPLIANKLRDIFGSVQKQCQKPKCLLDLDLLQSTNCLTFW